MAILFSVEGQSGSNDSLRQNQTRFPRRTGVILIALPISVISANFKNECVAGLWLSALASY